MQTIASFGNQTKWFYEQREHDAKSFESDGEFWEQFSLNSKPSKFNIFERLQPDTIRPLTFDIKLKFDPESDFSDAEETYTNLFKQTMIHFSGILENNGHQLNARYPERVVCLSTTSPMVQHDIIHARLTLPFLRVNGEKLTELYHQLVSRIDCSNLGANIEPAPLNRLSKMIIPLKEKCYLAGSLSAPFTEFSFFDIDTMIDVNSEDIFNKADWMPEVQKTPAFLLTSDFCTSHTSSFFQDEDDFEVKEDDNYVESIEDYNYRMEKEKISLFLNLVSDKRANNFADWLDIGAAISHLSTHYKYRSIEDAVNADFDYTQDGLNMWKEFTKNGNTFTDEDCERHWSEILNEDAVTTANTIEYFAIKDNKNHYDKCMANKREEAINIAISNPTHLNVGHVFKLIFPYEYVCTGVGPKDKWYYFNKVSWESNGIEKITQAILGTFRKIFVDRQNSAINARERAHVIADSKKYAASIEEITQINKLLNKIGDNTFINKLIRTMSSMYFSRNFKKLQNTLLYVTAFKNCVIDVRTGKAIPRDGKPEDYCTYSSKIDYKSLSYDHPDVMAADKYMKEVFRNKERREFMYRFFASLFIASNTDKIVPIWKGLGNNSKSVLIRLLNYAFGSYIDKISTSVLTEKRTGSDSATPALIRVMGKRLVVAQEPDKNDPIRGGTMKELSGGDTIAARELYQAGSESETVQPTFILGLMTNHKLNMLTDDQAVWERVVLINFDSRWVKPEKCPADYETQMKLGLFPIDTNFDRFLPSIAKGLIWLTAQHYSEYAKGLQVPLCVQEDSIKQRCDNNTFIAFAHENIELVDDDSMEVHVNEMYELYKFWFKEQGYHDRPPTKNDFVESLSVTLDRNPINHRWSGIKTIANISGF